MRTAILCATFGILELFRPAGIDFTHRNSPTGQKYLIETMGGGVALLDFNNDGRLDLDLFAAAYAELAPSAHPLLGDGRRVDLEALRYALRLWLFEEREVRAWARNPDLALDYFDRAAKLNEALGVPNPNPYIEIARTYTQIGQFFAASINAEKGLQLDPTNVHALTDIGTANFNLGKYDDSKVAWLKAKEIDPDDEQVHYNLGFLYANVEPVDYAAASAEWQAVVQLAPGSDLANTAQVHLDSLVGEEPSPAPTEAPAAP